MTATVTGRLTFIAVIVPLAGLAALIARAEYTRHHGPTWTIPIEGYDPRDLLHGRYLEYRYRFRWDGTDDTCGMTSERVPALAAGCCLCLSRGVDEGYDPPVRQTSCEEARARCDGAVRSEGMIPPLRYFLPEDRAPEVESALRTRAAAIELAIGPDGTPAVRELLLDRRPWRDVLER